MSEKIEDPFRVQIRHNDLCRISATAQEHEVIGTYVPITSCYLQNNHCLLNYVWLMLGIFHSRRYRYEQKGGRLQPFSATEHEVYRTRVRQSLCSVQNNPHLLDYGYPAMAGVYAHQ